jgi:glycosyltransferase involved in cell wall biosynthesis
VRVLWYGKWFPVDGNHIYLCQVTRRQADMGHTVAVVYHGRDDLNAQLRDGRIEYLPLPSLHPGPTWAIESLATPHAMERHIRSFRPDVVHASLRVGTFDLKLPALCARLDVPLVVTFHVAFSRDVSTASSASAATYAFYGRAFSSVTAMIALGPEQRRWLRRFGRVRDDRIHEIPNGVNHIRFCPGVSDWRQSVKEKFVVGYVGRLAPEKNLEALCRGFLQAKLDDARLVIVGQGPSAEKLRKKFGDQPSISLLPRIDDRAEVADLMRGLDVFVLPSLIEGLSLSLLEAMASGVVPVATEVGEHHSLVDGCGVLLHPAMVTDGVRRALIELAMHPERRKHLAAASRSRAQLRGWDRTASEVMDLYRKLI